MPILEATRAGRGGQILLALLAFSTSLAAVGIPNESEGHSANSWRSSGFVHLNGPPAAHTGGFGEPTCQICHIGYEVLDSPDHLTLEGLPTKYQSGETYLLTLVLTDEFMSAAGFQLSSRYAEGSSDGNQAGVPENLNDRVQITEGTSGIAYLHQTEASSWAVSGGSASWSWEWTAPEDGHAVVFHMTANAANGDNSPLEDQIYRRVIEVEGGVPAMRNAEPLTFRP